MRQVVIIGGGAAGLSALNRLVDLGIQVTLVEAGDYPSHKVCGEFFSPECLPILSSWDLEPKQEISSLSVITDRRYLTTQLPVFARSQSRFTFDVELFKRGVKKGATVLTRTKVTKILPDRVLLDSGQEILYDDLMIGSGRLFSSSEPKYIGLKAHIQGLQELEGLQMYPFLNGYAGILPLSASEANVACLLKKEAFTKETALSTLFERCPLLQKRLSSGDLLFKEWMICEVPSLGLKKTPQLPNTYFIGDAAGVVPPASGLGLSIAVTSGFMAADYVVQKESAAFQKKWKQRYTPIFRKAQCLHDLFMSPKIVQASLALGTFFPKMPSFLFLKTRFF